MARSQLLKDAVNGKASLENIFFRLKVILSDLESDSIKKWIDGEIEGYKPDEDLPPYRITSGVVTGNFFVNYHYEYKNHPVPLHSLISDVEEVDRLETLRISDGIGTLQNFLESDKNQTYVKTFSTEYCALISKETLQVTSMKLTVPSNVLRGILAQVKTKLIEVIMELEKEFDNLDDLDIRAQVEESESVVQTITHIEKIIYDNSIEIGDNNKVTKSGIGNFFGRSKK